jgi:hypothetical protein
MASLFLSLRASASPAAGGAAGSRHADPAKVAFPTPISLFSLASLFPSVLSQAFTLLDSM